MTMEAQSVSVFVHVGINLAQQLEGTSSASTASVFCAETAKKVQIARKRHPMASEAP